MCVRGSLEQHRGSSSDGDKSEYNVLLWCKEKHLQLTKYKTKELVVDFFGVLRRLSGSCSLVSPVPSTVSCFPDRGDAL